MIKDSEIVTKKYLNDTLSRTLKDFVTKDYLKDTLKNTLKDFVTKDYLKNSLKEQKIDIVREVKVMMHETMIGAMENEREYYTAETKMHMSALQQGFKDDLRYYNDEIKTLIEKIDNHETRITKLELA